MRTTTPWAMAEIALLRAVLRAGTLLDVVRLAPAQFSADCHGSVWAACQHLHQAGTPVFPAAVQVALSSVLQERPGELAQAVAYVDKLYAANGDTDADLALEMARQVRTYATVRQVRDAAATLLVVAEAADVRALDLARELAAVVALGDEAGGSREWSAAVGDAYDEVELSRAGGLPSVPNPFGQLDRERLFTAGALIMLAARPSVGKSALALRFAIHAAKQGRKVLHVTIEMRDRQLARRALSAESWIPAATLKSGALSDEQWLELMAAVNRQSRLPVFTMDRGPMDIETITARARRHKATTGLDMVVVDYIQRLPMPTARAITNKHDGIGVLSGKLKNLALELEIPVLCLAQISRDGDGRDGRRPTLSNLKDSGDLEQDADTVLLLSPELAEGETLAQWGEKDPRPVLLDVAKSRDGRTMDMHLMFKGSHVHFTDVEPERSNHA